MEAEPDTVHVQLRIESASSIARLASQGLSRLSPARSDRLSLSLSLHSDRFLDLEELLIPRFNLSLRHWIDSYLFIPHLSQEIPWNCATNGGK